MREMLKNDAGAGFFGVHPPFLLRLLLCTSSLQQIPALIEQKMNPQLPIVKEHLERNQTQFGLSLEDLVKVRCRYKIVCYSPSKNPHWVCNKDIETRLKSCAIFYMLHQINKEYPPP